MGYKVSLIKVDFPLPLTPVTTVNVPKGKLQFTFCKVLPVAPLICMCKPLPFLLSVGISIFFLPAKKSAVSDFNLIISFGVPCATIWPQ